MTTTTNVRFGDLHTGDRVLGHLLSSDECSVLRVIAGSRWGSDRIRISFDNEVTGETTSEIDLVESIRTRVV